MTMKRNDIALPVCEPKKHSLKTSEIPVMVLRII